jgi:hypothetical protein
MYFKYNRMSSTKIIIANWNVFIIMVYVMANELNKTSLLAVYRAGLNHTVLHEAHYCVSLFKCLIYMCSPQ